MITQQDLQAAIAECKGTRNPNSSTCIKLAAFLIIQEHLYGEKEEAETPRYSFSSSPDITLDLDTDFARAIDGKDYADVLPILDEMMQTVQVLHPKLYNSIIQKLREV